MFEPLIQEPRSCGPCAPPLKKQANYSGILPKSWYKHEKQSEAQRILGSSPGLLRAAPAWRYWVFSARSAPRPTPQSSFLLGLREKIVWVLEQLCLCPSELRLVGEVFSALWNLLCLVCDGMRLDQVRRLSDVPDSTSKPFSSGCWCHKIHFKAGHPKIEVDRIPITPKLTNPPTYLGNLLEKAMALQMFRVWIQILPSPLGESEAVLSCLNPNFSCVRWSC